MLTEELLEQRSIQPGVLYEKLADQAREIYNRGKTLPVIIFDLDYTLFDLRPRVMKILADMLMDPPVELEDETKAAIAQIKPRLMIIRIFCQFSGQRQERIFAGGIGLQLVQICVTVTTEADDPVHFGAVRFQDQDGRETPYRTFLSKLLGSLILAAVHFGKHKQFVDLCFLLIHLEDRPV